MVQAIPKTTDTAEITDILNANSHEYGEYGGQELTFYQGDVAAGWEDSLTDAEGNVFTLHLMGGDFAGLPLANLYENGHDISNGEGFFASMRLVNGEVVAQNGKGYGWFGEHIAGATDPGPGDNADTAVPASDDTATNTDDTPVATDDTPAAAADDTAATTDTKDTAASTTDTKAHETNASSSTVSTASTVSTGEHTAKVAQVAANCDYSHSSYCGSVDASTTLSDQLFAHCFQQ